MALNLMHVPTPLETAIVLLDDVAQLFVELGADFNTTLRHMKSQHSASTPQLSILDWVQTAQLQVANRAMTVSSRVTTTLDVDPTATGWKKYLIDLVVSETEKANAPANQYQPPSGLLYSRADPNVVILENARGYLLELEQVLLAHGAESFNKTQWLVPPPPPMSAPRVDSQPMLYSLLDGTGMNTNIIPQYQVGLYEELFEACLSGDSEKVQQMCLPQDGSATTPLNIFVQAVDPRDRYSLSGSFRISCPGQGVWLNM